MTTLILLLAIGQATPIEPCMLRDEHGVLSLVGPGHPDWNLCLGIRQVDEIDPMATAPATPEFRTWDPLTGDDGRIGIVRDDPEYGDRLVAWNRNPVNWQTLRREHEEHRATLPAELRSPPGYDCTNGGVGCPPGPAEEPVAAGERPWPDWRDWSTFMLPDRRGYLILDSRDAAMEAFLQSQGIVRQCVERMRAASPLMGLPAVAVDSETFLIHDSQEVHAGVMRRICPACVRVAPVPATGSVREALDRKLRAMVADGRLPTDSLHSNTLLTIRRAETWDERAALEPLSVIVDRDTERLAADFAARDAPDDLVQQIRSRTILNLGRATCDFVRERMLTLPMLPLAYLDEPGILTLDTPVAQPDRADDIPAWVRVAYAEWDDMHNAFRMASDTWIRAGWQAVQRRCPECETWDDWYCGSGATASLDADTGRISCHATGEPDDRDLAPNCWMPGDTSVPGMMYTFELRRHQPFDEYLEGEIPIIDPDIELPAQVELECQRLMEQSNALADGFEGASG